MTPPAAAAAAEARVRSRRIIVCLPPWIRGSAEDDREASCFIRLFTFSTRDSSFLATSIPLSSSLLSPPGGERTDEEEEDASETEASIGKGGGGLSFSKKSPSPSSSRCWWCFLFRCLFRLLLHLFLFLRPLCLLLLLLPSSPERPVVSKSPSVTTFESGGGCLGRGGGGGGGAVVVVVVVVLGALGSATLKTSFMLLSLHIPPTRWWRSLLDEVEMK